MQQLWKPLGCHHHGWFEIFQSCMHPFEVLFWTTIICADMMLHIHKKQLRQFNSHWEEKDFFSLSNVKWEDCGQFDTARMEFLPSSNSAHQIFQTLSAIKLLEFMILVLLWLDGILCLQCSMIKFRLSSFQYIIYFPKKHNSITWDLILLFIGFISLVWFTTVV